MGLTPEQVAAVAAILVAVVAAGLAKKWVWGWVYADMVEDRNFWRRQALRLADHSDQALDVIEKKIGRAHV